MTIPGVVKSPFVNVEVRRVCLWSPVKRNCVFLVTSLVSNRPATSATEASLYLGKFLCHKY